MFDNDDDKEYKEYTESYEYLKTGRPSRDKVISEDEITNLKITLETTHGIRDFLKNVK